MKVQSILKISMLFKPFTSTTNKKLLFSRIQFKITKFNVQHANFIKKLGTKSNAALS